MYGKEIQDGVITCFGLNCGSIAITIEEYKALQETVKNAPTAPTGHTYKLRADTLEWELVELPPVPDVEDEPTIEDKAEAYDILMGEEESE